MNEPTQAGKTRARKTLRGKVVSDKMDRTIVVLVERTTSHPLYRKVVRVRKKYYAHDPDNRVRQGDLVEIMATRPLSKLKRWRLVQVLEEAPRA